MIEARFVHTNLIAHDWRGLARFYEQVFGCRPVPPERELKGEWLEAATAVPDARLEGVHLRLPGYGEAGPTLEILPANPRWNGTRQRSTVPDLAILPLPWTMWRAPARQWRRPGAAASDRAFRCR
jgi:glyoxylase I family protein